MTQTLPEVLSEQGAAEGRRIELNLCIPASRSEFEGHFPEIPILSGVAQIDWAIRFARERKLCGENVDALENLRFLAPIQPGILLTLSLESQPEQNRLEFRYTSRTKRFSSGIIVFRKPENAG